MDLTVIERFDTISVMMIENEDLINVIVAEPESEEVIFTETT